ncbi:MAG: hypothetical protein WDN24_21535 [Sphingomonas sp.]
MTPAAFQSGAFEIRIGAAEIAALAPHYGEIAIPAAILYGRGDNLLDPRSTARRPRRRSRARRSG